MSGKCWLPLGGSCSCLGRAGYKYIVLLSRQLLLPVLGSCSCMGSVGCQKEDPARVLAVLVTSSRILLMSRKCWLPVAGFC